jgi:hypothetical protein
MKAGENLEGSNQEGESWVCSMGTKVDSDRACCGFMYGSGPDDAACCCCLRSSSSTPSPDLSLSQSSIGFEKLYVLPAIVEEAAVAP